MSDPISRPRLRAALPLLALVLLGAAPGDGLPPQLAQDVRKSWEALTTTYYDRVDPQALLAAASDALADLAKKHGVAIAPPELRASSDTDATLSALDEAIGGVAAEARGEPADYAYAAIAAMARSIGDRYTQFFTPEEFKQFNEGLDPDKVSGIGVMIENDPPGTLDVAYVIPGTPADRAGLRPGDEILAIDGAPAKDLSVGDASKLLRGKAGTVVSLQLQHATGEPPEIVSIKREEWQPPTVIFRMLAGNVGYVRVAVFGNATKDQFDTAIARLKDQGAKALVLDLRNDGGGYVNTALEITSRFIADKPLLIYKERGDRSTTIDADDDVTIQLPVTVLVNAYTASASEITAGALQDDGAGVLIGTKTFGKGVMQTLTPLPDGAAIKVTTAHYLTPRHRDINLRGIDPDLQVSEPKGALLGDADRDPQLRAALLYLQKKIAQSKSAP
ncbi:MAG TPA: S41 family peptidase [Verrucomicrobiae bacterium]|nr:S41 family peptidase [Verrucomicrobiae bacterium]